MATFFGKLVWYEKDTAQPTGFKDGVDITNLYNVTGWDVKKGVKARASSFDIKLKNNWKDLIAVDGDRINEIKIQPDDEIKAYADINPITESPAQLIIVGTVMAFNASDGGKSRGITIRCSDKSQLILRRVFSKVMNNTTAPNAIIDIIKDISQDGEGGFDINTDNVETLRPKGQEEDTGEDDFPTINFARNMKPIYEWIDQLSQVEYTNTDAELLPGGTLVCQKSFIWFLDENNNLHWFYPTDDIDYTLLEGDDTIYKVKLKKAVYDVVNMVIVRGGTDKNASGITWYYYDESTTTALRVQVIPKPKLADYQRQILIDEDDNDTTLSADLGSAESEVELTSVSGFPASGTVRINTEMIQYDSIDGSTLKDCTRGSFGTAAGSHTSGDLVEDATSYGDMDNAAFRELVKAEIKAVGANITKRLGSARWRGSIEVRGAKYTPGEIINLTIPSVGCTAQNLRIIDVHHQMTKKGWFTTLKLEEDENVVGN